ncbi:hypothetical protein D3C72_1795120 [compost metagenome]
MGRAFFVQQLLAGLDLQRQAFSQGAGAHAHRFQALQQAQRHGQVVQQRVIGIRIAGIAKALGQLGQGLFQVAVVVQGFDQKVQRGAVFRAQPQRQRLAVQHVLQADVHRAAVRRGGFVFVVGSAGAGWHIAAPLFPVGGRVASSGFGVGAGFLASGKVQGFAGRKIGLEISFRAD